MTVFLTTDRMVLRPLTEADADHLAALNSDPEVMRFLDGDGPPSPETVRTRILPRLMRRWAWPGEHGYWAAETADGKGAGGKGAGGGEFLGWFEFRPLDEDAGGGGGDGGTVELGYRLRRAAWGRGLATEGARALLRKGFTGLGVDRVTATTMAVNVRSRRVMEKAGLRYVRTFHQDWPHPLPGSEHGEVEYALTAQEWRREAPPA
ncbi:GNAT family N-acetyltransferase [Streptomyces sp. SCUT-3]|uniref:GNAT family N-acetyltransferase n=1 Tax=Streptomyces TaxID=1883 RepID=UPI000CAED94F|nr:GNAT family N-acetyltransferase [Streptomyces sp. SCUT-3]PLW68703.1 GNAT family N-acetyltransferase [Streptomyces sp. DJ]QMV21358.1 GNAT family N-acetyltransferase [Streptomyces sp. SCUT-3]